MFEIAQTVYSHVLTPNVDMCYLKLMINESPHFYEYMNAKDPHEARSFSVFVDLHKEFRPGTFFAEQQYGRFFIEHYRSTEDVQYLLDNRCPKIDQLNIVFDGGTFYPDRLPCPSGGVDADQHEQWMDFLANIRKFYDAYPQSPMAVLSGDCRTRTDFFYGLYKELPPGGTVTQVLCASVPSVRYATYRHLLDAFSYAADWSLYLHTA